MNEKHPPITEQTDGIEIHPIRTSSSQGSIHLHCWDFAGQVRMDTLLVRCFIALLLGFVSSNTSILHQWEQCVLDCVQFGSI